MYLFYFFLYFRRIQKSIRYTNKNISLFDKHDPIQVKTFHHCFFLFDKPGPILGEFRKVLDIQTKIFHCLISMTQFK